MTRPSKYKLIEAALFAVLIALFCIFVMAWETYLTKKEYSELARQTQIIENDLWNYDSKGSAVYLELVARMNNHEHLAVYDSNDKLFAQVTGLESGVLDRFLIKIGLIYRRKLEVDITHNGTVIGRIETLHRHDSIYLYLYLFLVIALIFLGSRLFLHSLQNLAMRKQAWEALQESERKLSTLISNLQGMAYRCPNHKDWPFDFTSDGALALTGYPAADFMSQRVKFGDLIHPEDAKYVWDTVQEKVSQKHPFVLEYRIRTASGQTKWIGERGAGVFSKDSQLLALEGFITDITEYKQSEEKITASLKEKEILLREVHHRVKNNLQVVSSLISLQAYRIQNTADPTILSAFRESVTRIKSMALVHERLYQSKDFAHVNFQDYVRQLAKDLFENYEVLPDTIALAVRTADVQVDINQAVPLGLIINELLSNALKHAFPKGRCGQIDITLQPHQGRVQELTVCDNGRGLPEDINVDKAETLGLTIVSALVDQLDGEMVVERSRGTCFQVRFERE